VRYRFGFDIGGTFTDLVLAGDDASVHACKVLSRHGDIVAPIVEGLQGMLAAAGAVPGQVEEIVAGATTAVTNLAIERKGARTGLVATQGFADVIEIGRELRYDIYDLAATFPDPIVPRALRGELAERIGPGGEVLLAPVDADIERVIRQLVDGGAQAIAVCLLHAYRNPAHEARVRSVAARVAPRIPVSLSSEVVPEIREYERTVATVLNAYAMPMIGGYLAGIESGLKANGFRATLRIMQSNGGIISREFGERMPIRLLESGPAAGALGAAMTAGRSGTPDLLAFDMGGTTAKACLVSRGEPGITTEFEVARVRRFKKGSGLPVRLPIIDLIEIGAGGGSIASVESSGLLKVGPKSAGSEPGPACYGLGGVEPTVTDAALLLGYLDPAGSLSGAVRLRPGLAEQAIRSRIARPLGMDVIEAASGIHRIVCEHMASAARIHAMEKGKDIRRYALLAFGGAGPMHAREVARRSGCREILVPAHAGVFSAVGLLGAPMKLDMVRTHYAALAGLDLGAIEGLYAEMAGNLRAEMQAAGVPAAAIAFRRSADLRYVGQGFEVNAPLPGGLAQAGAGVVAECFHAAYEQQYGQRLADHAIEALNWRLEATARIDWPAMAWRPEASRVPGPARSRPAFFPELGCFVDTRVIAEAELADGTPREGPALVEQAGSTLVVGPGDRFAMDRDGNIRVALGGA
jgi:N-methylhydantoinase A/oxoprolinase/acetone carboxylase beta subunit